MHIDRLLHVFATNRELHRWYFGLAETDFGVAGQAETFGGEEQALVHPAIAIFVVQHSDQVGARCNIGEADYAYAECRHGCFMGVWIHPAIGEIFTVARHADEHFALG